MHRYRNVALAAVLSLAVASCADAQRTALPPTVTDSAGIRIVTNAPPTNPAATLVRTPILDIGGGGDANSELAFVVGALRLGDGRVAIADQGTRAIRIFDASGKFIRAIGRAGGGPGEFSSITRLELIAGDSLAAYDALRGVLTVFDTAGGMGRTERIVSAPGGFRLEGILAGGAMILSRGYNPVFSRTSRLERDRIAYVAVRPRETGVDTIAQVAGTDVYLFAGDDFSSRRELPFGRVSLISVGRDRLRIGTGDSWQIETRAPDGRLVELHRVRHTTTQVTTSDIARFKRELLDRMKGTRLVATGGGGGPDMRAEIAARTERMLQVVPFPDARAPYDSLIGGPDDELWVRRSHPFAGEPATWTVLSRSGAAAGIVTLPAGMRPFHIGRDFMVGVTKDEDDVEHVVVHRLNRTSALARDSHRPSVPAARY